VAEATSSAQAQSPIAVSGCKLLSHPNRYNGKMVTIKGLSTLGFERDDISFHCPGRVWIYLSLNPPDQEKYGFLTEKSTLNATSQPLPGQHPGDNLTARKLFYALVTVTGLFRCNYDFPDCKGATRDSGSIIVKSMRYDTPMSETRPVLKPGTPGSTFLHGPGHADPPS
jgi:hypothetical protein